MSLKPSLHWLLAFVPAAFAIRFWPGAQNDTVLFLCSCAAIVPLAGIMGRATEELSERLGEGIGGLLNATFGNAAELIIAMMALHKGLIGVVKASITGSIIGNALLVLGVSVVAGGVKFRHQKFNRTAARASSTALTLAAIGLIIPSVFHQAADNQPGAWSPGLEQKLSLAIAVVLFATYLCILAFSLRTHKQLFVGAGHDSTERQKATPVWSKRRAMTILLIATVLVGVMSEMLVSTVEAARVKLGFSEVFVGIIVIAIIGNAAEHSTAVLMALKNKMDLSLGIAIGSGLQIALFVAPVLVFVSYAFGKPMDLEFTIPEVVAVGLSVHLVGQIIGDGETNWLEGIQLLSVYLIMAILFYFLPETNHSPVP